MSLELDFARRLGVGLGDRLKFDVQGVPVEGQIVSLREVHWGSFQPNFFVTFETGVLEEAPQVFLASVPHAPPQERESLQAAIVQAFPNVSVVDVSRAVQRILEMLQQLEWALLSTALLSILVGLSLVYAIARDQARARRWELNLLKVLGADFRQVRAAVDLEFGTLGLLAALTGAAASLLVSALLSQLLLDMEWAISWPPLIGAALAVPAICAGTARAATRHVLRERPLALLQATNST
jgi:putative ABC transport system permease protein